MAELKWTKSTTVEINEHLIIQPKTKREETKTTLRKETKEKLKGIHPEHLILYEKFICLVFVISGYIFSFA